MKTYLVTYTSTYEIPADSKEDAIDKASQANTRHDDGTWEADIDHYNSDNYNTLGVA